jgi:4-alpha-glucanotransferase
MRRHPWFNRSSGLILHPTSLPGPHGIGDFGAEAYRFVDFLGAAGQRLWQMLPLGPTGYGNSPYASRSAFAGNPLLISLDDLVREGLLSEEDLQSVPALPSDHVDFGPVEDFKLPLLRRASERLRAGSAPQLTQELNTCRQENAAWLDDYALFMALRDKFDHAPWQQWPEELRQRRPEALEEARRSLADDIAFHVFTQFVFWRQWGSLRRYANEHGIKLIGDIPIFVALDSADVWAHSELFWLDEGGNPTVVAGVPPDYFSTTGQRWGNPLYRWDDMKRDGYRWWIERLRATLALVDIIRIDHFRGFQAYWEIPAERETAEVGRWVEVPSDDFFAVVRRELGDPPVVVEDLGLITPAVVALRDSLGYPGMSVLQFAWSGGPDNPFLPYNHVPNSISYTGTHDNDTTVGWFAQASEDERDLLRRYLGVSGDEVAWDLIGAAMASVAGFAIAPVQDVLSLGPEARMNFPGKPEGNWSWRLQDGQLTEGHAHRLHELAQLYGRLMDPREDEEQAG